MLTESLSGFLTGLEVLADTIDMDEELSRMVHFMREGLEHSHPYMHVPMIPTFIKPASDIPYGRDVMVMAVGHRSIEIHLICFQENGSVIVKDKHEVPMPGAEREVSKLEFYSQMAQALLPYLDRTQTVGISFAFECEILPNLDGRIVNLSKEIRAPEVIGTRIVENLEAALRDRGITEETHMVVLNNTVASLLAGFAHSYEHHYSSYASFILDSGMNSAYIEDSRMIAKLRTALRGEGEMVINTEMGSYPLAKRSFIDEDIDLSTNRPGDHIFEKVLVGRYQGLQVQYIVREAIDQELFFSGYFADRFASIFELSEDEIHEFIEHPYGTGILSQCCANDIDREQLFHIIDNVLERVARYIAVLFCALHIMSEKGTSPVAPLAIALEAGTYYSREANRVKLNYYRKVFINEKYGFFNVLLELEQATVIGSALAALTN